MTEDFYHALAAGALWAAFIGALCTVAVRVFVFLKTGGWPVFDAMWVADWLGLRQSLDAPADWVGASLVARFMFSMPIEVAIIIVGVISMYILMFLAKDA